MTTGGSYRGEAKLRHRLGKQAGMIAVILRGRHAAKPSPFKEPYPVKTIQLCSPAIHEAIAKARVAIEQVSPQAHADLAIGAEAAEVMGALTEDIELATALLVRPVIGREGLQPEVLTTRVGRPAPDIGLDTQHLGELGLPRDWSPARGLDARQAETLRKM